MHTDRTPLLSAPSPISLNDYGGDRAAIGFLGDSEITLDFTPARRRSCLDVLADHPKLSAVIGGSAALGLVAGASAIVYVQTHSWLTAAGVFGAGGAILGCIGDCLVNCASSRYR